MRHFAWVLIFTLFLGCASLRVPAPEYYPFRAEFSAAAVIGGKDFHAYGALLVKSDTEGVAQIYGPAGLTAFTLDMKDGVLSILDAWGRKLYQYSIPVEDVIGLIAGTPPRDRYIFKRKSGEDLKVTYTWGSIILEENMIPKEIHVRGDTRLDVFFDSEGNTLTLLIIYGSDTLRLSIQIKEGGRWL